MAMTMSTAYAPGKPTDGTEPFLGLTTMSLVIYASSGLLAIVSLFVVIAGCVYCRKTRRTLDIVPQSSKDHDSQKIRDHYDQLPDRQANVRTLPQAYSTLKRLVQINIETDMDGKTSISQTSYVADTPAEPIPPRKAVSFRDQKDNTNKTGTLPKYQNTAIKSKKNYLNHELHLKPKPAVESPYDYPSSNSSSPCLKPKCDTHNMGGVVGDIVGYMEVLPNINKEPLYEPLNTKL